jgi:hypothetical protein
VGALENLGHRQEALESLQAAPSPRMGADDHGEVKSPLDGC